MTIDIDFSWAQYLSMVLFFVGVPTAIGAGVIWVSARSEWAGLQRPAGNLALWATGLIAFGLGFVACAGWLSWSADYQGRFRGPGLPAPNQFPTWQVIACGVTVVLGCLASAHLSRLVFSGGLAAAAGTAAGFTAAFCVVASTDPTGQAAVGVVLSEVGWGLGLTVLMLVRGALVTRRASVNGDDSEGRLGSGA